MNECKGKGRTAVTHDPKNVRYDSISKLLMNKQTKGGGL